MEKYGSEKIRTLAYFTQENQMLIFHETSILISKNVFTASWVTDHLG